MSSTVSSEWSRVEPPAPNVTREKLGFQQGQLVARGAQLVHAFRRFGREKLKTESTLDHVQV